MSLFPPIFDRSENIRGPQLERALLGRQPAYYSKTIAGPVDPGLLPALPADPQRDRCEKIIAAVRKVLLNFSGTLDARTKKAIEAVAQLCTDFETRYLAGPPVSPLGLPAAL